MVSEVGTIPLILIDRSSCQFSIFFREIIFVFLSSREDIWRVVAFNGVLIYFGSHLPYLFSRLSIISGFFFLYWPPFLYILFSPCSFCSSVRQIFWRHCCGWNIIYLYFDLLFWTRFVIFFTNLSLYSQIYWLSGFIFPVIILSTDIVWALVITYFNWQCSILYHIRVVHIPK